MNFAQKLIYSQNPVMEKIRSIKFLRDFYTRYIKKFDNTVYISLTMSCNLNCSYCTNNVFGPVYNFKTLPGDEWIKIINRERKPVVLSGGEPTLYPELIKVINGIDKGIEVKLFTNLKWSDKFLDQYIQKVNRPVIFYASFHEGADREKFLHVLNKLRETGKFQGSVHAISIDKNRDKEVKEYFAKRGVRIGIDEDLCQLFEGASQEFKKKVLCSRKNYIVAPNGDRFRCASYMLRNLKPIENIHTGRLSDPFYSAVCHEYGYCAPCDLIGSTKIKKLN